MAVVLLLEPLAASVRLDVAVLVVCPTLIAVRITRQDADDRCNPVTVELVGLIAVFELIAFHFAFS